MKKGYQIVLIACCVVLTNNLILQAQNWQSPEEANQMKNPFTENIKSTEKGRKIYSKLCWSCHGKTGKGDGPAALALKPAPANYGKGTIQEQTDGAIFWKITNGKGSMASYKSILTDDQRWMLVNYIRFLAKDNADDMSETGE